MRRLWDRIGGGAEMTGFAYALKTMSRDKSVTMWTVLFPLALASLFWLAFSGLDESYRPAPVKVVVADDAAYRAAPGLAATVAAAAAGEAPWLDPTYAETPAEAARLVADGGWHGYIAVGADGAVGYHRDWRQYADTDPGHAIVAAILDGYLQTTAFVAQAVADSANPANQANQADPANPANPANQAHQADPA
ncbi:MAG: ABC transporter permease, partial [Bifidobacteriaceae bacterium]|nr:ABC transporter permease [Bifidobacteriaceae bacterium]